MRGNMAAVHAARAWLVRRLMGIGRRRRSLPGCARIGSLLPWCLTGRSALIAEVGLGKAGLVMSLDASRLARNNRDWHQLLELCSLFGVLIADGERLYDPLAYHDRLLLGLPGI